MAFVDLLPGAGMYYQYFVSSPSICDVQSHISNMIKSSQVNKDNSKTRAAKRILTINDADAILRALNKKHPVDKAGMKQKFDEEIAAFINSGTHLIEDLCNQGREIPEGADF